MDGEQAKPKLGILHPGFQHLGVRVTIKAQTDEHVFSPSANPRMKDCVKCGKPESDKDHTRPAVPSMSVSDARWTLIELAGTLPSNSREYEALMVAQRIMSRPVCASYDRHRGMER